MNEQAVWPDNKDVQQRRAIDRALDEMREAFLRQLRDQEDTNVQQERIRASDPGPCED